MARILIADDHSMMRKGLRTAIEPHAGWEICGEATTGQEALDQTQLLKPDLVVLDVSMPVQNGHGHVEHYQVGLQQLRLVHASCPVVASPQISQPGWGSIPVRNPSRIIE